MQAGRLASDIGHLGYTRYTVSSVALAISREERGAGCLQFTRALSHRRRARQRHPMSIERASKIVDDHMALYGHTPHPHELKKAIASALAERVIATDRDEPYSYHPELDERHIKHNGHE